LSRNSRRRVQSIAAWISGKNRAKKSSRYSSSASFHGLSKSIASVVRRLPLSAYSDNRIIAHFTPL